MVCSISLKSSWHLFLGDDKYKVKWRKIKESAKISEYLTQRGKSWKASYSILSRMWRPVIKCEWEPAVPRLFRGQIKKLWASFWRGHLSFLKIDFLTVGTFFFFLTNWKELAQHKPPALYFEDCYVCLLSCPKYPKSSWYATSEHNFRMLLDSGGWVSGEGTEQFVSALQWLGPQWRRFRRLGGTHQVGLDSSVGCFIACLRSRATLSVYLCWGERFPVVSALVSPTWQPQGGWTASPGPQKTCKSWVTSYDSALKSLVSLLPN